MLDQNICRQREVLGAFCDIVWCDAMAHWAAV
jgi:hypothetical protein